MTTLIEFQRAIAARMRRGESFSTIEDELIKPSRLSNEAKSALWLYGWSFVDRRAQRREAQAHIAQIATRARRRKHLKRFQREHGRWPTGVGPDVPIDVKGR